MAKQEVNSTGAPPPSGAYSQGIRAGDFLFLSGQGPFDSDGDIVDQSFEAQVRQTLANLTAVAAESGRSLKDAVRVGVYLHDISTFEEMDAIYRDSFPEPRPARTTIETPLPGFGIEIDAVIYLGD
ncbi:MAG: RidA family protein [Gemmatimonadales bacterium]|jgi:2-iminobutanoate/2-iminopropanoate deaminase|nr:RidA family protein [Gemmatimonadales bacterium]MBT7125413.1 RidA family protein [Gemmatimonadales bacterium]